MVIILTIKQNEEEFLKKTHFQSEISIPYLQLPWITHKKPGK